MARYRVTVPKQVISGPLAGAKWRNVYLVEADTYDSALAVADIIAGYEMGFTSSIVGVKSVSAHLTGGVDPPRTVGKVMATDRNGSLTPTGSLLPFWNCVRVDFEDTVAGRPERKYYRPPLYTSQVDGLVLDPDFYGIVVNAANQINALENYTGPSGELHNGAVVNSLVQMRQTGWHRRKRAGFIRGYVPVAP